jgi:hypothetical protein
MPRVRTIAAFLLLSIPLSAQTAQYRHVKGHLLNDLTVTPGKVNAQADVTVICVKGYTSQPGVRNVTAATKKAAYENYHATHRDRCVILAIAADTTAAQRCEKLYKEPCIFPA